MSTQIQTVVNELGAQKQTFLDNMRKEINSYITRKSWRDCLTILQLYHDGTVKSEWRPAATKAYLGRLIVFTRGKKYSEGYSKYDLDSGLTPGVVDIVIKEFEKFYTSEDFSKVLLQQIMKDRVFVEKLAETIIDATNGTLPTLLKKQLAERLVQILEDSMGDSLKMVAGKGVVLVVGKAVSLVVATGISNAVLAVMMKNMALLLKGVLSKILATTAIKTTLISLAKKAATVKTITFLSAVLSPILAKIAAGISIPVTYIVAPILAGIIAWIIKHEAENLPVNMGEKVSLAVCDELSGNFEQLNKNVITEVMKSFSVDVLGDLAMDTAKDLIADEKFKADLESLIDKVNQPRKGK